MVKFSTIMFKTLWQNVITHTNGNIEAIVVTTQDE